MNVLCVVEVVAKVSLILGQRLACGLDALAPQAAAALAGGSILPAAEGIVTTDLYPKIRRADIGGGSIVGGLWVLGAGLCGAGYMVGNRLLGPGEHPLASLFLCTVVAALVLTAMLPFFWKPPATPRPRIDGGGNTNDVASWISSSWPRRFARIASWLRSADVRSSQGANTT